MWIGRLMHHHQHRPDAAPDHRCAARDRVPCGLLNRAAAH
jgi:hypothetical protein